MTAGLEGVTWSAARPGRTLPPGKTRYPFYMKLGVPPGPVRTGGKSRPHRDSIPDRPPRSQSLYRLSYPAHGSEGTYAFYGDCFPRRFIPHRDIVLLQCEDLMHTPVQTVSSAYPY